MGDWQPLLEASAERPRWGRRAVLDDDRELAERHRRGDARAFEELYRRYAAAVINLAWRLSGSRVEAEDLGQEIFLRVFRHLARFRGEAALRTWIFRVAINHCRSRLGRRRAPTEPLGEGDEGGRQAIDPGPSPERQALASDEERQLERALAGLPPVFREAVVLRDVEGLAYEEIATALEVPVGTVRSRIARGREQLRRAIEAKR